MIDPQHMKLIQVLITNKCNMSCTHCSQMCPHQQNKFFMSLEEIENALCTLRDYPGHIGCMGGEPTLHPQFKDVLALYRKYVPVKARRELWTNGANYEKYRKEIEETFYKELIAYNEHEEQQECWHQPNHVAACEVFSGMVTGNVQDDHDLMWKVIDNCWVQNRWSAMITPMGAYYCEVAAARANVMSGPKGIAVREGWWKEPMQSYEFLKRDLCSQCGMCLPMPMVPNDKQEWDDVSPRLLQRLKRIGTPFAAKGKCQAFNIPMLQQFYQCRTWEPETEYELRGGWKDFPEWRPWNYRDYAEKKHSPEDVKRSSDKQHKRHLVQGNRTKKTKESS